MRVEPFEVHTVTVSPARPATRRWSAGTHAGRPAARSMPATVAVRELERPACDPATPWPSSRPPCPAGGDDRPGQRQMAEAVGRRHPRAAPPRRAGRHRDRQEPGLPGAGPALGQPGGGRHRHQGPPGPARRPGTCPSCAEHLDVPFEFAVLKGRSNYLCRQRAAEVRGRRRPARPRRRRRGAGPTAPTSARSVGSCAG